MRNISNDEFENKYYKYKQMIYNISYTYVKNTYDADDITQDVFMKYLNSDEQFATEDNEKFWLIRVTINTSKTFVTSSWKKKVFVDEELINRTSDAKKEVGELFELVCKLPSRYKEPIVLFYYENMSIGEIVTLMRGAVTQTISLIAPVLIVALIVGLIIAILQAVTSIQEQTLTFLPKLLAILFMIALLGGTMMASLSEYTIRLFNQIPNLAR